MDEGPWRAEGGSCSRERRALVIAVPKARAKNSSGKKFHCLFANSRSEWLLVLQCWPLDRPLSVREPDAQRLPPLIRCGRFLI